MSSQDVLVVDCVGRPFRSGMLYDVRRDCLLPGLYLWDKKEIKGRTTLRSNPDVYCTFWSKSSFEDKTTQLNFDSSIQASFLAGLVSVEGSASYMKESRSHLGTEAVSFIYRENTDFEEISVRPEIKHREIVKNSSATHIVTGVQFGGMCILSFERSLESLSAEHHSSISLQAAICQGKGGVEFEKSSEGCNEFDDVSVRYVGDFALETVPTTFQEGLEVVKQMPTLIKGQKKKAIRAYLVPIDFLDSSKQMWTRPVSENLISHAGNMFQKLRDILSAADSLLTNKFGRNLSKRNREIERFRVPVACMLKEVQTALAKYIPLIRNPEKLSFRELEHELRETLADITRSRGVTLDELHNWVANRELEEVQLRTYITILEDYISEREYCKPCFDRVELVRELGKESGVRKIILKIPTFIESPLLNLLQEPQTISGEEKSLVPGLSNYKKVMSDTRCREKEKDLVEGLSDDSNQPIEDAIFNIIQFEQSNTRTEFCEMNILLTEDEIVGKDENVKVKILVDDLGMPSMEFKIPSEPLDVEGIMSKGMIRNPIKVTWNPPKEYARKEEATSAGESETTQEASNDELLGYVIIASEAKGRSAEADNDEENNTKRITKRADEEREAVFYVSRSKRPVRVLVYAMVAINNCCLFLSVPGLDDVREANPLVKEHKEGKRRLSCFK